MGRLQPDDLREVPTLDDPLHYDPLGRRIGKACELLVVEDLPDTLFTAGTTETLYGRDGDTLAFESNVGTRRDGHRGRTIHYVHEAGSFVPLLQAREGHAIRLSLMTDVKALKAANFGEYDIRLDPMWNGDLEAAPQQFAKESIAFYQCDHLGTPMELTTTKGGSLGRRTTRLGDGPKRQSATRRSGGGAQEPDVVPRAVLR